MDRGLPFGVIPKKRFGQNFLVDKEVIADLIAAVEISKSDTVIEVGAGTGVLTEELAKRAGKVFAFEIDRDLISVLQSRLRDYKDVKLVNQDFLKQDCLKVNQAGQQNRCKTTALCSAEVLSNLKLIGSIPYQITSPLLHKLLTLEPKPTLVVLLIQKEVAEKITAKPPKATYLSNIVKLLGNVEIVRSVPKTAFWPAPEVDGAIVKLVPSAYSLVPEAEIGRFQRFLHRGFQNPRKMLRTKFDPGVLKSVGIDPTQRAQELQIDNWFAMFDYLNNRR